LAPIFESSTLPPKLSQAKNYQLKARRITSLKKSLEQYLTKINDQQIVSRYKSQVFNFFKAIKSLDKSKISRLLKQWHQQGYILKIALVTLGLILFLILHNL
jgi:hypothetical protein